MDMEALKFLASRSCKDAACAACNYFSREECCSLPTDEEIAAFALELLAEQEQTGEMLESMTKLATGYVALTEIWPSSQTLKETREEVHVMRVFLGWDRVRELRKDLKTRLSALLDEIGYWDHIVVKPVN
jgi:recombinational DNA repair protein RecR